MRSPRPYLGEASALLLLLVAGTALWLLHATTWDLGGRSPILTYDSAQYAVAARELAWHGRLATPFALPIDLVSHPQPPWPLSVLQPGLVLIEAAIFRLVPANGTTAGSDPRAWLTLILPFCSYLLLGAAAMLAAWRVLASFAPDAPAWARQLGPVAVGFAVLLDPEAQHFAMAGLTELPFTVGLLFAFMGVATGAAARRPLLYGIGLGLVGLFRANMLWLAPMCVLAAAVSSPGARVRTAVLSLAGFCLPLAPWWLYKWKQFGSPTWDLTRYVVWTDVRGMNWFSLYHLPRLPQVPAGTEAVGLLAGKLAKNLPVVALAMLTGPRALWLGALAVWVAIAARQRGTPGNRRVVAAGALVLAGAVAGALTAAIGIPWLRYVFPTRVLAEPAGLLACWALAFRAPLSPRARAMTCTALAVLALGWGAWSSSRALEEARQTSRVRGVPTTQAFTGISVALNQVLTPGETVMSNLGPALAWQTNHTVVHLALTPEDVPACRQLHDFRHVLLVFRDSERAWPGWQEIMEREGAASMLPELGVTAERRFRTDDGFTVVWLQLGVLAPGMAFDSRPCHTPAGWPTTSP